mmetsp:Transcript_4086/g.9802  ORF Transcript_4086/g.9802 Transcript_4086/m.9802 type:complete len:251 (+) Transcript_4086:101-853(+)
MGDLSISIIRRDVADQRLGRRLPPPTDPGSQRWLPPLSLLAVGRWLPRANGRQRRTAESSALSRHQLCCGAADAAATIGGRCFWLGGACPRPRSGEHQEASRPITDLDAVPAPSTARVDCRALLHHHRGRTIATVRDALGPTRRPRLPARQRVGLRCSRDDRQTDTVGCASEQFVRRVRLHPCHMRFDRSANISRACLSLCSGTQKGSAPREGGLLLGAYTADPLSGAFLTIGRPGHLCSAGNPGNPAGC